MEIIIEHPEIKEAFERWVKHFGDSDPYATKHTIGMMDVLRAHFLIADYFYNAGYGIASVGPKDPNLLHSAIYRQFVSYSGRDKWIDPFEKCATLVFGIIKDHPFHDANKRTGLLVMLYFLQKIGMKPKVRQKELEDFVVDIAEDSLRKHRRKQDLDKKTDDPEVYFIADYLRRKAKKFNTRSYPITYQEMNQRLRDFHFCLRDTNHSKMLEICRIRTKRPLLRLGSPKIVYDPITKIPFTGWKHPVARKVVSDIRRATKLTPEKGIDSETFFQGADPLHSLISEYNSPLQRLANR